MLGRLDAQIEGLRRRESDYGIMAEALAGTGQAIEATRAQTAVLLDLFDTAKGLRLTIRDFNRFFTAIMEAKIDPAPGNEVFCDFLIERTRQSSGVPDSYRPALELYKQLVFGDPTRERVLPFEFARLMILFTVK